MKKEPNILLRLASYEDITPTQTSDFISLSSGFSVPIEHLKVIRCGKLMQATFRLSRNVAWNAGATANIGTIQSAYRAAINSMVQSDTAVGICGADGNVFLKPTAAITANAIQQVTLLMILA